MLKKALTIFGILGLSFIFAIISILVFITKGNPELIKQKLKIGAILLTFTGAINLIGPSCTPCYVEQCYVSLETSIKIEEAVDKTITFNESTVILLNGTVNYSNFSNYSFIILNSDNNVVLSQNISASDGAFDESTEKFIINTGITLPAGEYKINFYRTNLTNITDNNNYLEQFTLNIN